MEYECTCACDNIEYYFLRPKFRLFSLILNIWQIKGLPSTMHLHKMVAQIKLRQLKSFQNEKLS